jgi:hypothetical protein
MRCMNIDILRAVAMKITVVKRRVAMDHGTVKVAELLTL